MWLLIDGIFENIISSTTHTNENGEAWAWGPSRKMRLENVADGSIICWGLYGASYGNLTATFVWQRETLRQSFIICIYTILYDPRARPQTEENH